MIKRLELFKRSVALICVVTLLVTLVPSISSMATGEIMPSQYNMATELEWTPLPEFSLDFEDDYTDENGAVYYSSDSTAVNWSNDAHRGSHAEMFTEADGNRAIRLTYDNENSNENYKANSALNIYDSRTKSKFIGESGQKYIISFSYRIENTDDKTLQFFIATCGRSVLYGTDLNCNASAMQTQNYKFTPVGDIITETTDDYVTVNALYTANGTDYPLILLSTNGTVKDTTHTGQRDYASVLIDNVEISLATDDFVLDFEEEYKDANGTVYYDGTTQNWSSDVNRGSHAELFTEADGNTAVRLTYDNANNNENYKANTAFSIYDPNTNSRFIGASGKKYSISFSYKIENTDDKALQFYIAYCAREYFAGTDLNCNAIAMATSNYKFVPAGDVITETTDNYVTVKANFVADGTVYPLILLSTNLSVKDMTHTGQREYASVLVDNVRVSPESDDFTLDFEEEYQTDASTLFYSGDALNWSNDVNRGSHIELFTEADGNTAVRMTYDNGNGNENYKANTALSIYDPNSNSRFIGTAGKKYIISFSYKIENTDDKTMQFNVAYCARERFSGTDLNCNSAAMATQNYKFISAGDVITKTTDNYVTVKVQFVANGTDYPIILLSTNGTVKDTTHTGQRAYASALIDNITVEEEKRAIIICHDYDDSDKAITINKLTRFGDLTIPSRKGYVFEGWYKDADLTMKASNTEYVGDNNAIYVKWSGDGNTYSPMEVTDTVNIGNMKEFVYCGFSADLKNTQHVQNSTIEQVATAFTSGAWFGSYVISNIGSSDNTVETLNFNSMGLSIEPSADTVIFYIELPECENLSADSILSAGKIIITQNGYTYTANLAVDNKFSYLSVNSDEWVDSSLDNTGTFTGIGSGFKGYIRIDFSALNYNGKPDLKQSYTFNNFSLRFNSNVTEHGDIVLGGIFYVPTNKSNSTVMKISDRCWKLTKNSSSAVVTPYEVFDESKSSFSVRYSGTAGEVNSKFEDTESSAFWGVSPIEITTNSGDVLESAGYMNTYKLDCADILMQPGVDTIMFYVEMPKYSSNLCGLKFLSPTIEQSMNASVVNSASSIYSYLNVEDGGWKTARTGSDGEMYAITSGFKGYIKIDIKMLKGFNRVKEIDFTKPYYLKNFELAFNNIGGDNGSLVIGGIYSLIEDSTSYYLTHYSNGVKLCAKVIDGDLSCDGSINATDVILVKRALLGTKNLEALEKLRADICGNGELDIRGLIKLKSIIAGAIEIPDDKDENEVMYKNIFTPDVATNNSHIVYAAASIMDNISNVIIIAADTALNSKQVAIDFAAEINSNKIGDFEKTGIDRMCHVSTFIFANNNIYMSYYANTQEAQEDPSNQVARLAYCPEDDPDKKIIIDIQAVGDDMYGQKVVGVYDTILMQKEGDDTNLYVLWTANIAGKYYRLYRTFNMKTEQLGDIGVNRFKVGDIVNDFSTSGIQNALAANGIGYKSMYSDIGIMQKLSTRLENDETYYYTGAYSGDFTCIIKSKDLITWEYVAQPDVGANGTGFANQSKWENAVYVLGDKCYYFVRQQDGVIGGFLTAYDLVTGEWDKPVLVGDCQSRSDFIVYNGNLYLFYAPTDRNHIGILKIDTDNLENSTVVLQANMQGSCFYPFVQYGSDGELYMSYTVSRQHIRLAKFTLSKYIK